MKPARAEVRPAAPPGGLVLPSRLALKVTPGSSRDRILGWRGDRLKIAVQAPAENGKANAAVLELLARELGIPRRQIRIVGGERSGEKTVEIDRPHARPRLGQPG